MELKEVQLTYIENYVENSTVYITKDTSMVLFGIGEEGTNNHNNIP